MFRKKKLPTEEGFKPLLFEKLGGNTGAVGYSQIFDVWKACHSIYGLSEVQMLDGTKIRCHDNWSNPDWFVMANYARNHPSGGMWVPEDYEPPS